jgi:hypothetical protein
MLLFETSASVFEIMWNIALTLFIIRISFVYCTLTFLTGCLLTYLRTTHAQQLPILNSLVSPLSLVIMTALWAKVVIVYYEIPRVRGFRLAIGLLALFFMVVTEAVVGLVTYEEGWSRGNRVWKEEVLNAVQGVLVFGVFALMPLLMMAFEGVTDEMAETYHGHEKSRL